MTMRTEGLKATVFVCTSCTVVSMSTRSVDFDAPPLTVIEPLMQVSWAERGITVQQ